MEPVSRFGSGSWAFSSSLVTRRGSRRFSFKRIQGWGATRPHGRCCTSFDRVFRPFPRHSWRATSRPTRPTSVAIARDGAGKVGVVIAVERRGRTAGCVRLAVIPAATTAVLTSFVKGAIVPQAATVHTDAWAAYRALTKMGIDHRPRKGGHGRHAVDGLSWAHTVFGNLKTWLRGAYHGVSPKHLQRYLNEFQFRFNKRWHEADLFSPVLHAAIAANPFPYRHLTAERTG
jgi:transposase-like protein